MKVPVLVDSKAVLESTLCHLKDGVLDSVELALDHRIVFGKIGKGAENFQSLLLASFKDQP